MRYLAQNSEYFQHIVLKLKIIWIRIGQVIRSRNDMKCLCVCVCLYTLTKRWNKIRMKYICYFQIHILDQIPADVW